MKKRLLAFALTIALCFGLASTAFAATSPNQSTNATTNKTVSGVKYSTSGSTKTASITKASNKKTVVFASSIKNAKGQKCVVKTVKKNAIQAKNEYVTLRSGITKIESGAFSKGKKVKVIYYKMPKKAKAKSYTFGKTAFKGTTKNTKMYVGKNMSKKEFNKFKQLLKKAGFKGKVYRKWL